MTRQRGRRQSHHHHHHHRWWRRRGRRLLDKINGGFHETILIEGKVLVAVCIYQSKGGSHGTVHGCFPRLAPSPSQVGPPDARGKHKGFFRRHPDAPSNVGSVEHPMGFGVADKSFHRSVIAFGSVLFDHVRFSRFRLGALDTSGGSVGRLVMLGIHAAVVPLFATHRGALFPIQKQQQHNLILICSQSICFAPLLSLRLDAVCVISDLVSFTL